MFGHEETDWLSPFETARVPAVSTTLYDEEGTAHGFGQVGSRPPATRTPIQRAQARARARVARARNPLIPVPRHWGSPFPPSGDLVQAERHLRAQSAYHGAVSGFGAFGDATVPFTTSKGVPGTASANTQSNCGSLFGVQQMLSDLGYPAAVDGIFGPETSGALSSFAQEHGVTYQSGTLPQGPVCQALEDTWVAHSQPDQPTGPVVPPGGGTSMPATTSPGITDSIKNWWTSQTTTTKYLIAGGGAVAGALLIAAMVKTPTKRAHA